jgi:hypothetical protein
MKIALLLLTILALPILASAQTQCPGHCVNVGGNPNNDGWCDNGGANSGEAVCRNFANAGCAWIPRQLVQYPGRCVNVGGNPNNDAWCNNGGANSGPQVCRNFANAGCAWIPGQQFCQ